MVSWAATPCLFTADEANRNASDYISAPSFDAKIVEVVCGQILNISGDESKLFSGDITASKDEIKGVAYKDVYAQSHYRQQYRFHLCVRQSCR